ncbi:MAG: histidine phosphatase family protein [Ruminococcaceae bacterium]|nr:histidine phosphatase family protein [Oscillospiraceae bacterium]
MKTTLIFIRHGQSESNKDQIFTGHTNTELTKLGVEQARLVSVALKDVHIDKIYASDLSRAYDTGLPVAQTHGLTIEKDPALREIHAGKWNGLHFEKIAELYPDDYKKWMNDIGRARCTGGESVAELYRRVVKRVLEISEENLGKTVCIASHATPVRAVCAYACGIKAEELAKEPFPGNASITVIEYENGQLTAKIKGDTSHLGGLATFLPDDI